MMVSSTFAVRPRGLQRARENVGDCGNGPGGELEVRE